MMLRPLPLSLHLFGRACIISLQHFLQACNISLQPFIRACNILLHCLPTSYIRRAKLRILRHSPPAKLSHPTEFIEKNTEKQESVRRIAQSARNSLKINVKFIWVESHQTLKSVITHYRIPPIPPFSLGLRSIRFNFVQMRSTKNRA